MGRFNKRQEEGNHQTEKSESKTTRFEREEKKMSKIVFIEPKAPNLHIYTQFALPRLGSYILGTLMKKRGWAVDIIFEEIQKIDFTQVQSSDLVGISTITSTAPRAYLRLDFF